MKYWCTKTKTTKWHSTKNNAKEKSKNEKQSCGCYSYYYYCTFKWDKNRKVHIL